MSIYIHGMDMPTKENTVILISPNGDVWMIGDMPNEDTHLVKAKALSVPPHGGLIDLKAPFKAQYYDEMTEEWLEQMVTVEEALYGCMVDEMPPTIIPASESKERPAFLPQYELTPRSEEGGA